MEFTFEKYHGLGNDYLVFDVTKHEYELTPEQIRSICDRHFGVGSDGILMGPYFKEGKIAVRIYNPDGSEAEKSGNGIRIFAKFLKDFGYMNDSSFELHTLGGAVQVAYLDDAGDMIKVSMGIANYNSKDIPVGGENREVVDEEMRFLDKVWKVSCLTIGNPHCVIVTDDLCVEDVKRYGAVIESAPVFPNKINVQFLKIIDRNNIQMEIYERGAGYTLASGSSCCAALSVTHRLGLTEDNATVHMPGGCITVEIGEDGMLYMTGMVKRVGKIVTAAEFITML